MKIITLLTIFGTIFILNYEGWYWDPCDGHGHCFAIDGHHVPEKTVFCDSLSCVEETLDKTGANNLESAYRIDYSDETATIKKVKIGYRATIE